jgi:hypothetical protein
MEKIKSYKEFTMTNEEIFGFGELEKKIDPNTKSKWFVDKTLSYAELAKKFGVGIEHIAGFEEWLDEKSINGKIQIIPGSGVSELDEEEYKFQMEANYAETLDLHDGSL